ncbi:secretion protein snm4 [Streptomyces sp. AS58]|uniref:type VII secretion integral membrane protein EccD n=1 Tax=Streptomyces sp. AS58 TaxID=1519489 RepID=UPI0006AF423F|nr:type VII secretion integral membrane protein EccD [Streptomyces sp. AS58]KOV51146.1 secretion protein snm4 [Streptomyces sp. AS58]
MPESSIAGLCRLTVRTPHSSLDLVVPSDVPVADLLPAVLRHAGPDTEEHGLEHAGWVLQTLGGKPLEGEGTLTSSNVNDGEVLYLRPRTDQLPEVRLDDLVDGIADSMRDRLHTWGPRSSRMLLRALTGFAVCAGLLILASPGLTSSTRVTALAVTAALLLAAAATAGRAADDAASAAVLGSFAPPCIALAGALVTGSAGGRGDEALGAALLAAGAAGAGSAALALALVGVHTPFFSALILAALAGTSTGVLMAFAGLHLEEAALVIASIGAMVSPFVPSLAFKLAGMRMPFLPSTPRQLQEDIEPYSSQNVASRTEIASTWMTALYGAVGAVVTVCFAAAATSQAAPDRITAAVLSLLLLLHGRSIGNVWQRLSMVLPGAAGLVMLALSLATTAQPGTRLLLAAAALATGGVLAVASWFLPGRRIVPHWGRAAEILHSALAMSLLPLLLWVLGVFGRLRGFNG